jgi:hypothetical protein
MLNKDKEMKILHLMKKFSFMFLLYQGMYYILLLPLLNHDRLTGPDPLDPSFVLYLNNFMIWLIIGSVWAQEQLEFKYNGDAFLRTLPIQAREIVLSKFALVLLSVIAFVSVTLIWLHQTFQETGFLHAARNNLLLIGNISLIITGLIYLGFYRFGYLRFGKIAIFIWFMTIVTPIPLRIFLKKRFQIGSDDIVAALMDLDPVLMSVLGLAFFLGAALLAIRFKTRYTLA